MNGLLEEELTQDEVKELLQRLHARDLGGSEHPTVGAVVEALDADPLIVGRMLAEIRKEDFEERFGLRLDDHERRLDALETRTPKAYLTAPPPQPRLNPYQQQALDKLADQERLRENAGPIAILAILIVFIFIFGVTTTGQQTERPVNQGLSSMSVGTVNGGWIKEDANGRLIVKEKDGSIREPTEEEKSIWASLLISDRNRK